MPQNDDTLRKSKAMNSKSMVFKMAAFLYCTHVKEEQAKTVLQQRTSNYSG